MGSIHITLLMGLGQSFMDSRLLSILLVEKVQPLPVPSGPLPCLAKTIGTGYIFPRVFNHFSVE